MIDFCSCFALCFVSHNTEIYFMLVKFEVVVHFVHGSHDDTSLMSAELFHARHQPNGHRMRRFEGADRAFTTHVRAL